MTQAKMETLSAATSNPIYARDIKREYANDGFFGEGFEALCAKAEAKGQEVVVGYFLKTPIIEA